MSSIWRKLCPGVNNPRRELRSWSPFDPEGGICRNCAIFRSLGPSSLGLFASRNHEEAWKGAGGGNFIGVSAESGPLLPDLKSRHHLSSRPRASGHEGFRPLRGLGEDCTMHHHSPKRVLIVALLAGVLAFTGTAQAQAGPLQPSPGLWQWLTRAWEEGVSVLWERPAVGRGHGMQAKQGVCIDPNGCPIHTVTPAAGPMCHAWSDAGACIDPNG